MDNNYVAFAGSGGEPVEILSGLLFIALYGLLNYFIGSIPFGLIVTKLLMKKDIRAIGSGNIGATNVLRTGNKKLAAMTLSFDLFKGAFFIFFVLIYQALFQPSSKVIDQSFYAFLLFFGLIAILGHCFPIWLKFKGGKGVATGLGVLLAAVPYAGLAACAAWIATAKITKYSSLSALIAFLIAPIVTLFIYGASPAAICALITLLIWIRHKDNIKRLLKGEESKIGQKNKPHPEEDASEPVSK